MDSIHMHAVCLMVNKDQTENEIITSLFLFEKKLINKIVKQNLLINILHERKTDLLNLYSYKRRPSNQIGLTAIHIKFQLYHLDL